MVKTRGWPLERCQTDEWRLLNLYLRACENAAVGLVSFLVLSFNLSLGLFFLLQGLIRDVNRCFSAGYLPPLRPLTRDGCRRLQLCILLETDAARTGISITQEQRDCSSPDPPCLSDSLALCSLCSCHLCPPSNNIFLLSAVPRRLQGKEIRGRRNYRWGKSEALFTGS